MRDSRRTRIVLAVLLVAALGLITLDFRDGGSSPARGFGASVFGPVERLSRTLTSPVSTLFDSVTGGPSARATIADLQRQNALLRAELSTAQQGNADAPQLTALMRLAGRGGYQVVAADVIAAGGDFSDTVTLDVGTGNGIKPDDTVLNGSGLVGTVTQASSDTCTVLLITDATAVAGVRLSGGGQIGEITGTGKSMSGPGLLKLRLFDANAVLRPGQQLVTLGSVNNQPYVPGVPVGTVISVQPGSGLTQSALVRPFADFTALGVVGVVVRG